MAKTETLHIRVEPNVKQRAEETTYSYTKIGHIDNLNDLGLSITEAINVFLNQVILNDGIPFEIRKPKYNKQTIQAIEDTKNGKNLSKTFDSIDEMFEELDK